MPTESKAGFVALIGAPNVGKSTLLNRVVGTKVSIVTHKPQTTRSRLRGVAIRGGSQIIFVDTPGLFEPRSRFDQAMVAAAWRGAVEADIAAFIAPANLEATDDRLQLVESLVEKRAGGGKLLLVVNKIDLVAPDSLLEVIDAYSGYAEFDAVFLISAVTGSGVDDFADWLASEVPSGPWLYPPDQIADFPLRIAAAEITREKLMLRVHQELPYRLTVETESWEDLDDGAVRIAQIVYVGHDRHKGIILGANGRTIKQVGVSARKDISKFLDRDVHLFLHVKARPNWMNEAERYSVIGLDYSDGEARS